MNPRRVLDRLDRVQKSRLFKLIASVLVIALVGTVVGWYAAERNAAGAAEPFSYDQPADVDVNKLTPEERELFEEQVSTAKLTVKALNQLQATRLNTSVVALAGAVAGGLALIVIWIGLGLTALLFLVLLGGIAGPVALLGEGAWAGVAKFALGVGLLGFAFLVLMELLRLLLSPSSPVLAVARNVVMEAVRMKVSLIFIVMLIFGLAVLPALLDPGTPLRYRVQSFLQYGTSGMFWITALLVLFLSVATVAFEQRERIIWQTMTKPVAAWQYLLGKWLGVVGIAAILLGVGSSGVFLFTEYLREQPAQGEVRAFVPRSDELVTEDRAILQSQVLTARRSARAELLVLTREQEDKRLSDRVKMALNADPKFTLGAELEQEYREQIRKEYRAQFDTVEPGQDKEFVFRGLGSAREAGSVITLRYKIEVGANDPRATYRITFLFRNVDASQVREVPLGQMLTIPVPPGAIDPDGSLYILVVNGDVARRQSNPASFTFPPGGLEVFYPVGSYRLNFFRVVLILWLKLAFLSMVGVTASTFLSFAVASLVSFGVFLIAETSGYLFTALEYYGSEDDKGNIDYFAVLVRAIAVPVSRGFKFYADLKPVSWLVNGQLVSWSTVLSTVAILSCLCLALFATGVAVFRKRELATYSGQ